MKDNSQWVEGTLGDILTFKRGYDLPKKDRREGCVPIVSSSGVTGTHNSVKAKGPGVVTGRYGTLGEVFFITKDFWPLNTTLYVKDFKGNSPRFLSYFLRTINLAQQNTAGAVPGLNRNALHLLQVRTPPLKTQRKIATILSAYDDLIENNTRRIKILEEMAQTIYREWFVNFRFPGHENVKLVDSPLGMIPEGWEVKSFGDIFTIKYGKTLPKSRIFPAGDYPVYGAGSVIGFFETYISQKKVTLITCRGNGSGTVWRTREMAFVTNNSLMLFPTSQYSRMSYSFIELLAKYSNIAGVISGSAQPQITIDGLSAVMSLLPTEHLIERFCEIADGINDQIDCLYRKNKNLRQTRDLLLPKLISGAVDVSNLEVEIQAA